MKKFLSLFTSGMIAVISVMPSTVTAVYNIPTNKPISEVVQEINSMKKAEETPTQTTTANHDSVPVTKTTQAPPQNGETRAFITPVNTYQEINIGDDVKLSEFMLELSVWGFDDEYFNDMYRVEANELNYRFSLGMHDSCYTIDMSEVDTKKAGTYTIHVEPTAYAKDTFVLRDSTSKKFPNGEYEFEIQGGFLTDFDLTVYVNDPTTTATTQDPMMSTTQAPPQNGEVRAAIQPELNAIKLSLGEKFSVDDISLRMSAWGFETSGDYYSDTAINYIFSVGSGKHADCYTIDASEVDTSKAGSYRIYFNSVPNVKEKVVLNDSHSSRFPNGEYEWVSQGSSEFVIDVWVYDPALMTTVNPQVTTTTIAYSSYATQTTVAQFTTTTATTTTGAHFDYMTKLEYDNSIMQVGESRKIRFYNPGTNKSNLLTDDMSCSDNITIEYNKGDDFVTITAIKPGNAGLYVRESSCAFGGSVNDIYIDGDPTIEMNGIKMTKIEYDNKPMKIGESRKIRFYNPKTRTAGKATIEHSDNISVSYNEGDDFIIITALKEGIVQLMIHDETCEYEGGVYNLRVEKGEFVLYGDANCDGEVNIADATAIIQHLGNKDKYVLTEQGEKNADCCNNGDGVTGSDAIAIQKLEAKLISSLPVTE